MPFRAVMDGVVVAPVTVPDQQPVECPECGGTMYPREGDARARHFFHVADDAADYCSAARGESDTHARCTALAAEALQEDFGEQAARWGVEFVLDVPSTPTEPPFRRADALLEFESEHAYYGQGIIIEVQHKHHTKDIQGTTYDYLSAGYSVAWVTPSDFGDDQLDFGVVERAFRAADGDAYNVSEYEPWEFKPRVEADMRWDAPDHASGRGSGHEWIEVPAYLHPDGYGYEACTCGARRRYDNDQGRFVYDYDEVLAPSRRTVSIPLPTTEGTLHEQIVDIERDLASRKAVAPCRGPNGVHEWQHRVEHEYTTAWTCHYCPVRLVRGVQGNYILVGDPTDDVGHLLVPAYKGDREKQHYCVGCDTFVEEPEAGECPECSGFTVVKSFLDSYPENWQPAMISPSQLPGRCHQYLDVSVELYPPVEEIENPNVRAGVKHNDYPQPNGYTVQVEWPNHLPYHQAWVVPDTPIVCEAEAKAWLSEVLATVDAEYDPQDLASLARGFGGDVAAAARETPVVTDELDCPVCGAFLPHYYGGEPSEWYRYHYQYVDDAAHPAPESDSATTVYGEFYGSCPHCEEATNSPHELIDHLQDHGYTRDDAFSIMQRLG